MSDWTPEQIAAAAEAWVAFMNCESCPPPVPENVALAVLSAVDLSDHDRAVAADAVAASAEHDRALYENGYRDALTQAADEWDGHSDPMLASHTAAWLRARAEAGQ